MKPPQITLILAIGPWGRGVMHLISPLGGKGLKITKELSFVPSSPTCFPFNIKVSAGIVVIIKSYWLH